MRLEEILLFCSHDVLIGNKTLGCPISPPNSERDACTSHLTCTL